MWEGDNVSKKSKVHLGSTSNEKETDKMEDLYNYVVDK